jgi:hypothetical protein
VCLHFAMRAPHRITNPRRLHAGYGSASPILGASEHATRQRITNPRVTSRYCTQKMKEPSGNFDSAELSRFEFAQTTADGSEHNSYRGRSRKQLDTTARRNEGATATSTGTNDQTAGPAAETISIQTNNSATKQLDTTASKNEGATATSTGTNDQTADPAAETTSIQTNNSANPNDLRKQTSKVKAHQRHNAGTPNQEQDIKPRPKRKRQKSL